MCFFFFFFQAEDGIRDIGVTRVQTCALPISALGDLRHARRIPLPGYPLRRDRHWIDPAPAATLVTPHGAAGTAAPAPAVTSPAPAGPTNVDAEMLAIVRAALNLPAMGVHEDFFAVGGE